MLKTAIWRLQQGARELTENADRAPLQCGKKISDVLHRVLESEPKLTSCPNRTWLFQDIGLLFDQAEQVGNQKDTIVKKISQTRKHS